jgi:arylsulfatase A-like enzyme
MVNTNTNMLRIIFLFLLVFTFNIYYAQKPNVIIIMTDDQGYGDFSFNGNPFIKTPHIDQLASQSFQLTDFHVAPMCTPTRGQLITGIDAFRNHAINVSSGRTLLDPRLKTIANYYKQNGYSTALFGKWHLGDNHPYRPMDRGFDYSLWFGSSHINSVSDYWNNDYFDDIYNENNGKKKVKGYCTDVFFEEASKWAHKQKNPFFIYLATNAAHWPHFVPEKYRESIRAQIKGKEKDLSHLNENQYNELISFLAMGKNIDENIGKLQSSLKKSNLLDNTIVVFLTDNGSTMGHIYYNAGMKGNKTTLWEGGHRVPCLISWPSKIQPIKSDVLTQVQDLLPTLLDLSDIKTPTDLDGVSLKQLLFNKQNKINDRKLVINYSRMPGMKVGYTDQPTKPQKNGAAVLWKKWRLLENKFLYNIENDPSQENDLSASEPIILREMQKHLDLWWDKVKRDVEQPMLVSIGQQDENPVMLTACEWLDVFVDQQKQIRLGEKKNGVLNIDILRKGRYRFTLRRWPKESKLKLDQSVLATKVKDGSFLPGEKMPIVYGQITIGGVSSKFKSSDDGESISFEQTLDKGQNTLKATFFDKDYKEICGAYYVYVQYLGL